MTQKKVTKKSENKTANIPDYKGDGIAVWENLDINKKPYLAIKIVGHTTIYAFKQEE